MPAQQSSYTSRLLLLEAFRFAAWGKNPFIKEATRPDHIIEYLDFGEHLPAVRSFCRAVDNKLVVFKEYGAAINKFEGVAYENGTCITGQPGFGESAYGLN